VRLVPGARSGDAAGGGGSLAGASVPVGALAGGAAHEVGSGGRAQVDAPGSIVRGGAVGVAAVEHAATSRKRARQASTRWGSVRGIEGPPKVARAG
jgi:hypothetical protein